MNSGFAKIDANDNTIRLRDIFSLNGWKDITRSHSFVPLVGWSKFIQNAPRNLILVCLSGGKCMGECNMPDKEIDKYTFYGPKYFDSVMKFAQHHNFRIMRKVCYNSSKLMTNKEFTRFVYGKYYTHRSTVIFKRLGGILHHTRYPYRVPVSHNIERCTRPHFHIEPRYSDILQSDQKYIAKFLPEVLMLRMEWIINYISQTLWSIHCCTTYIYDETYKQSCEERNDKD